MGECSEFSDNPNTRLVVVSGVAGGQSFDLVVGSWKPQPLVGPVVGVRACH